MPERNKTKDILIGVMAVAMIVIGVVVYQTSLSNTVASSTDTSTPAFVTIKSNTVEGIVTEIISPESLVRIYDPERKVVYSITVPSNTLLADKGNKSISIGDRIRAVSTTTQDAFEFHADSVTIVSHQADQFPISQFPIPPSVQKIPL
jgi:hypothetical protein